MPPFLQPKTVSFVLVLGEERDGDKVAKQEHLSPLERNVLDLAEALSQVKPRPPLPNNTALPLHPGPPTTPHCRPSTTPHCSFILDLPGHSARPCILSLGLFSPFVLHLRGRDSSPAARSGPGVARVHGEGSHTLHQKLISAPSTQVQAEQEYMRIRERSHRDSKPFPPPNSRQPRHCRGSARRDHSPIAARYALDHALHSRRAANLAQLCTTAR